jgi:hypothetical protein
MWVYIFSLFVCLFVCFSEILRAVDSLQLTEKKKVATPADWKVRVININHIYSLTLTTAYVGCFVSLIRGIKCADHFNYTFYPLAVIFILLQPQDINVVWMVI